MGGADAVLGAPARHSDALEQLGHQPENGAWRNEYLLSAHELRNGVRDLGKIELAGPDVLTAMTIDMLLDYIGIRLNGPRAWHVRSRFNWLFAEADGREQTYAVRISNGALVYTPNKTLPDPDAAVHDLFELLDEFPFWFPIVTP